MTTEWVRAPSPVNATPRRKSPSVTPVAANMTFAARDVLRAQDSFSSFIPSARSFSRRLVAPDEPRLEVPAHAAHRGGRDDALGRPPMPMSTSTPVCGKQALSAPATSPSPMSLMRRSGLADLLDEPLVSRAVQDHDRQVLHVLAESVGDVAQVFGRAEQHVDGAARPRAHRDLLHVGIGCPQQLSRLRDGDDADGVGAAGCAGSLPSRGSTAMSSSASPSRSCRPARR